MTTRLDSAPTTYDNAMYLARYIARKHHVEVYVVSTGSAWYVTESKPVAASMYRIVSK